jgi:hypothetical protein
MGIDESCQREMRNLEKEGKDELSVVAYRFESPGKR